MYKKNNRKKGGEQLLQLQQQVQQVQQLQQLQQKQQKQQQKQPVLPSNKIERSINSININNELYGTLLSDDENNEINEIIPLIYKQKITQIFKNYKATNNGLIIGNISDEIRGMYKDILTSDKKIEYKGGMCIYSDNIILQELNDYCREITVIHDTDEKDIFKFIHNRQDTIINKYDNLKKCISENKTPINNSFTISRRPIYDYSSGNIDYSEFTNGLFPDIEKSYKCFEYNKDIVTAFEANYYSERNIKAIKNFIEKQQEYIDKLDMRQKRIIQDYTNENSYRFYCDYINDINNNQSWFSGSKNFGDAFYTQIHEIYESYFSDIIQDPDMTYGKWITNNRNESINAPSKINLTITEWKLVLNKFMEDLNEIIMNSPPVEEEIYCYRGVSSHFITGGSSSPPIRLTDDSILIHSIKSHKLYSFSLDFNVAYKFYNLGTKSDKALYRITILPQCRVLYVEQLTVYKGELEFIAPNNSIFYYNIDNATNTELIPSITYNNISKEDGICPTEKFYSFDAVLAFTPQPTINEEMLNKAKEIAINTAKNFTNCYLITGAAIDSVESISDSIAEAFLNICSASN